jgi:hypothetical protein
VHPARLWPITQTVHLVTLCKHLRQQVLQHGPLRKALQELIFLSLAAAAELEAEVRVAVEQVATSKRQTTQ